jgi:hypothetical protein
MRYFTIIDFQAMVLALFLGLCCLVLIYLAWAGYQRIRNDKELDRYNDAELIAHHGHNPVPPVLKVIFTGIAIWALIYLVIYGILGGPIA